MTREEWEDWKDENFGDIWALKDLAEDNGCDEVFRNFIYSDEVDSILEIHLHNRSWTEVYEEMDRIIGYKDDEYFELDSNGNLDVGRRWDIIADEVENFLIFED